MATQNHDDKGQDNEIDRILEEITAKADGREPSGDAARPDANATTSLDLPEEAEEPEPARPEPQPAPAKPEPASAEPATGDGPDPAAQPGAKAQLDALPKVEDEAARHGAAGEPEPEHATAVAPVGVIHEGMGAAAPEEPRRRGSRAKRVGIAVGAIACGLAAVYVGGSVYFSSHFMPNTTVNGDDVSGQSEEELASTVTTVGESYAATVSGDNLSFDVKASDIDLTYDGDSYAASAMSQSNPWAWPLEIWGEKSYVVNEGVSYDEQKLTDLVTQSVDAYDEHASQPTNASLSYDADSKQFEIVPEEYGTAVDASSVVATVERGVAGLETTITLGEDELVQPSVTSDDETLKASQEKANSLLSLDIPLNINGSQAAEVTPDMIAGWITIDDSGNVSVDTAAIQAWTTGDLSEQFDSVGTSRTYTRADGKEVTVSGGTYGWSIDGATLAQTISDQILAESSDAIDVPMKQTAEVWNPGGAEWSAYIDVDLTEQHARYYDADGNILWESDFVSGNPSEGHETPTGVYTINSNMESGNVELRGVDYNGDGEPDYISYVTYWMPFVDNLVAFHDATWRGAFGGSIYTYDGSHGCVNLPYSAAQELYGMVSVGTVVVVHD